MRLVVRDEQDVEPEELPLDWGGALDDPPSTSLPSRPVVPSWEAGRPQQLSYRFTLGKRNCSFGGAY